MQNNLYSVRKVIESQYDSICDIFEYKKIKDSKTKITNFKEIKVVAEKPCKISFEDIYVNSQTDTESKTQIKVKLFISPEIEIKPGSKIVVRKKGKESIYQNSSISAIYDTHQEILLNEFKGWA